jgi:glyoxylase-like metal-dependent hydrolase (beta-lactamase superfamily II)
MTIRISPESEVVMNEEKIPIAEEESAPLNSIAPDLAGLRILFVNVFGVSFPDGSWTLIDAGVPHSAKRIRKWADESFGVPPRAIVLTHGHFDHAGSAKVLADEWNVPVYAHPLELQFLNGTSSYPPPDPMAGGGVMALLSPLYPSGPIDLGNRLRPLTESDVAGLLPGWRMIHTPGHTIGHISFFRESDGTLLVGDALCTVQSESMMAIAQQRPELHGPPSYYTPDWIAARASVDTLASLQPRTLAPGHGQPVSGADIPAQLERLSARFEEIALPDDAKQKRDRVA